MLPELNKIGCTPLPVFYHIHITNYQYSIYSHKHTSTMIQIYNVLTRTCNQQQKNHLRNRSLHTPRVTAAFQTNWTLDYQYIWPHIPINIFLAQQDKVPSLQIFFTSSPFMSSNTSGRDAIFPKHIRFFYLQSTYL